jgi:hypothetical protein
MPRGRKRDIVEAEAAGEQASASSGGPSAWLSANMVSQRVVNDTRRNYTLAFKYLSEYAKANIPNSCDESGLLRLPMSDDVWVSLLEGMSAPLDEKGKVKAFGTLQSYVSAIKFYYQERVLIFLVC